MAAKTFRFLHASDFHLERPPGGLTDLPIDLVDTLLDATYKAVDAVFDTALREQVEFVILSGDILHFPTASPRAVDFLCTQFGRLQEQKIPVFWLGGQLEADHPLPDELQLPDNVHLFSTGDVQTHEVRKGKKTIAYVVGQSRGGHAFANLDEMRVPRDGRFFVGLWHCDSGQELDHDQLDDLGIDYWALGGRHESRSLQTMIPAAFSGSPQGRGPAEAGPHGCLLVTVTGDDIDETQLVETDMVRYRTERIVVQPGDDRDKLAAKMKSRMQTIRHDVDAKKPILVSWEIEDDDALGRSLRRWDQAETFLEKFRRDTPELHGVDKGMWSISLSSQRASFPTKLFDEDSILGDFLRVLRGMEDKLDPAMEVADELPKNAMGQRLEKQLQSQDLNARRKLLQAVSTLGIDLLSGESK